ncbi:MAG TPA: tyrosine-type recombinase/integrase [Polyangia bacterium]|jgi:integrase/recombinase XerD|nr:tyrosine-type recombinase/integrase [Polyangia bacterium]
MTSLHQALEDYLRTRRQLGFGLKADQLLLENFVAFMQRTGAETITSELAVMWARMPVDAHPHRWSRRLSIVRCFARYVATLDPETEIPSTELLRAHRRRVAPYIYSPAEITALMKAAGRLTPPLRAASYRTVIGLMATTGLRLGEALGLDRQDVDLAGGALHVRAGKPKQREVPLHPTATSALGSYARQRDRRCPSPQSEAFFLNAMGDRLAKPEFNYSFAKLIGQVGLEGAGERVRPRPHDLRHTLAVRTLLDWVAAGEDVDRRMPELSTFLGHVQPESTYWYLQAVPELMALTAARLPRVAEVLP